MFREISHSATQTQEIAATIAQSLPIGSVVLLEGDLGSGKTTFTQGLGKALGVQRAIKSPTYTIVKEYTLPQGTFIHIDAYRLEDGGADSIDLPSYLRSDTIVMIEWAVYVEAFLPENYLIIRFTQGEIADKRFIEIDAVGEPAKLWLQHFVREWGGRHGS